MATKTRKKGGGGKLSRTEVVAVRLDPKLRYGAELAARKHRRTLSSFIEWAIEEAVKKVEIGKKKESAYSLMDATWDVDEGDRFVNLAKKYPEALTYDEEKLWKVTKNLEMYWRWLTLNNDETNSKPSHHWLQIWGRVMRDDFDDLKMCAEGKLDENELHERILDKYFSSQEKKKIKKGRK